MRQFICHSFSVHTYTATPLPGSVFVECTVPQLNCAAVYRKAFKCHRYCVSRICTYLQSHTWAQYSLRTDHVLYLYCFLLLCLSCIMLIYNIMYNIAWGVKGCHSLTVRHFICHSFSVHTYTATPLPGSEYSESTVPVHTFLATRSTAYVRNLYSTCIIFSYFVYGALCTMLLEEYMGTS